MSGIKKFFQAQTKGMKPLNIETMKSLRTKDLSK